jgi:hypothetical protein
MSTVEQQVKAIVAEQLGVLSKKSSRSKFLMKTPKRSPRSSRPSSTSTSAVTRLDSRCVHTAFAVAVFASATYGMLICHGGPAK